MPRNLGPGGFVGLSRNFDSPQEFAKLEMNHPGGENHAQKLFPKPKIPGSTGDHLKRQISSRSSKSLRRPSEHGEKLGQEVQRERFGSICQERRSKTTRRANQGTRTACRSEGAGDHSVEKFFRKQNLTTEQKVELVENTRKEHGLNVSLRAAELPKSTYYYHQNEKVDYEEKYSHLKPKLDEIIDEHPGYGRDKIKTELEENHGLTVNHKVIAKLLRTWDIKLARAARSTEPSPVRQAINEATGDLNLVKPLEEENIGLFDVLYTDFTEIRYGNGKVKAWLIPVIGHRSKLIFGWAVGKGPTTEVALEAWKRTRETFSYYNASLEGTILHQDQDSVFTSNDWVDQTLIEDDVKLSYSENGARGNVWMESFNGHFKCPNKSLFCEGQNLEELRVIVEDRINYWNNRRRHASLQNRIPIDYIEEEIQDENRSD